MDTLATQLNALRRVVRRIVAKGDAGTWKTTAVRDILPAVGGLGFATLFAAPEGSAANVLEQRTGCPERTVHSAFYQCGGEPVNEAGALTTDR